MENDKYLTELTSIYLNELVSLALSTFLEFYNKDRYISKKEIDSFLDQYHVAFHENLQEYGIEDEKIQKIKLIANHFEDVIASHNALFLQLKMTEYKDYFDTMFASVDSSIVLDEEQRRAILIDEDYSLVVAGAGCGKTTTMAAKAKYLVEKCGIEKENIILLVFTDKQVEDLNEIVNARLNLGIDVMTFHDLGRKLLTSTSEPFKTVVEEGGYQIVIDYLKEVVFPDKEKLRQVIETFPKELYFDDICYQYDTYLEYYNAYKQKRYFRVKDDLKAFITTVKNTRFQSKRTLNGEQLKSKPEVLIANFLYENGIYYEYEKKNLNRKEDFINSQTDFILVVNGKRLYVEYFGFVIKDEGAMEEEDLKEYHRYLKKKEKLDKKYGRSLISLYAYQQTGKLPITVLEEELKKRNVPMNKRSEEEIFSRIMDTTEDWQFLSFAKLMCTFIAKWKEDLKKPSDFEELRRKATTEEEKKQIALAIDIYCYYEETLRKTNRMDLADMINYASSSLEVIKEKGIHYQYVIVDEYQDLSISRYQLMKNLADILGSKITAIEDDWKVLYEEDMSDRHLFESFRNSLGYGELVTMTNAYRNNQELIDVARDFLGSNSNVLKNNVRSEKHLEKPIEIVYYYEEYFLHKTQVLEHILEKLNQERGKEKILLLGRYKDDIEDFLGDDLYREFGDKIIFSKHKSMDITFLTVQQSRGLGFDQVILLNALDETYGFPSKKKEKPLLALLKDEAHDTSYQEERRLFYIALTRTKNKIYILAPFNEEHVSSFVQEIKHEVGVIENKDYIEEEIL